MSRTDDKIPADKIIAWVSVRINLKKKKKIVDQAVEYRVNIRTDTLMVMLSFAAPYDRTQ
jgi:hypothetical protein